jgi:hypothetical protein
LPGFIIDLYLTPGSKGLPNLGDTVRISVLTKPAGLTIAGAGNTGSNDGNRTEASFKNPKGITIFGARTL